MAYATPVVAVAATTNINISAPGSTIDGVSFGVSFAGTPRVLLAHQTTSSENGVWEWNGALVPMSRPGLGDQYKTGNTLDNACLIWVQGGITHAGTVWGIDPAKVVTVDTDGHTLTRVVLPPVQARVATTGASGTVHDVTTYTSYTSIDGVTLVGNGAAGSDIVLVMDQGLLGTPAPQNNGFYWANSGGAMARCSEPLTPGRAVVVSEGEQNAHMRYELVSQGSIAVGTTAITFSPQNRVFNVLDYGLLNDGTNPSGINDTQMTALVAIAGRNETFYFPAGQYRFDATDGIGPFPYGAFIEGAGVGGNDNALGTDLLFYGSGVGIRLVSSPTANPPSPGVVRDLVVLGKRGTSAGPQRITASTGSNPMEFTTAGNHGWSSGDKVIIRGTQGKTAANSSATGFTSRTITVTASNKFTVAVTDGGKYAAISDSIALADANSDRLNRLVITTTSAHAGVAIGATVNISGVTGIMGTGAVPDVNGEWQIEWKNTTSTQFRLMKSGTTLSYTGGFAGSHAGGTFTYGGHCLKVSDINEVGIELLGTSDALIDNVDIGDFKYGLSLDGAETSKFYNVSFTRGDMSGYKDMACEMGIDSACAVRIGEFKFTGGASTNGGWFYGPEFNNSRWGVLHLGGIGHHFYGGNFEMQGGAAMFAGGTNVSYDGCIGEGSEVAVFLFLGSATNVTFNQLFMNMHEAFARGDVSPWATNLQVSGCDVHIIPDDHPPILGANGIDGLTAFANALPQSGSYAAALCDVYNAAYGTTIGVAVNSGTPARAAHHVTGLAWGKQQLYSQMTGSFDLFWKDYSAQYGRLSSVDQIQSAQSGDVGARISATLDRARIASAGAATNIAGAVPKGNGTSGIAFMTATAQNPSDSTGMAVFRRSQPFYWSGPGAGTLAMFGSIADDAPPITTETGYTAPTFTASSGVVYATVSPHATHEVGWSVTVTLQEVAP